MDKYSFILYHATIDLFLEKLQSIGLVDITRENRAVDSNSNELFSLINRYSKTIRELTNAAKYIDESLLNSSDKGPLSNSTPTEMLEISENSLLQKISFEQQLDALNKELQESRVWGMLKEEQFKEIDSLGYRLHLHSVAAKSYNPEWENIIPLQILNSEGGRIYFATLSPKEGEYQFELPESKIPSRSYHLVAEEIEQLKERIEQNKRELINAISYIPQLKEGQLKLREEFELYMAKASSKAEAEGSILVLNGFAPSEERERLKVLLEELELYYLIEEAQEEDNPPIKLRNNFFTRLYEPIGELYMLPKYGELDLTPYFAPFYMLFFGFCLGDMGYGLTLFLAGWIGRYFAPKLGNYLRLVQFLGIGAVIMASLSGVFFGAKIQEIFNLPDSINALFFSDLKMFWFAIIFGIFQIVFARIINALYLMATKGWQYGLHNIGWSIVIVWASWFYATTANSDISIPPFMNYIAIAGALLILLFTSDSGSIFTRLFKGTTAFYDVTSVFGDILSYIRLFGLGTAGGILGMVVNSVASSLSGISYVGWFFALIMLLVGHTLVLLLSSLGAFVHPMRLTFVEFYKNAGFEGGGRSFKPLREIK